MSSEAMLLIMNLLNSGERDRYPSSHNRKDEESTFHRREREVREVYYSFFLSIFIETCKFVSLHHDCFLLSVCFRIFGS